MWWVTRVLIQSQITEALESWLAIFTCVCVCICVCSARGRVCVWGAWGATPRPDAGGAQRQRPVCQPPVQPQPGPSERLLPAPHQQHQLLRPLPTSKTAPVTPHTHIILNCSSSGGQIFCWFLSIFNICRIRSTRHQKISQHAAAFARTFPASTNTRTEPPFSIRSTWFSRILAHVHQQALRFWDSNQASYYRWCVSAGTVLGVKLHEVRLRRYSVWAHAHLLLLQLPTLQWNRVYEGTCIHAHIGM